MNINQQLMDWAKRIPMKELYSEIRRVTKILNLQFTSKVYEQYEYVKVSFKSQDLIDQIGFLNIIINQLNISNGPSIIKYKEIDEKIYPIFYGSVVLTYSINNTLNKNSDNCELFSFKYDGIGWTFN